MAAETSALLSSISFAIQNVRLNWPGIFADGDDGSFAARTPTYGAALLLTVGRGPRHRRRARQCADIYLDNANRRGVFVAA
ncbi:MAG: hypothetical protein ACREQO_27105 [Candidatus Binatia bacterium]